MSRHDPTASLRDMLDYALKAMQFCENKSITQRSRRSRRFRLSAVSAHSAFQTCPANSSFAPGESRGHLSISCKEGCPRVPTLESVEFACRDGE